MISQSSNETKKSVELVVVVPVYNEEDVIVQVLEEWKSELKKFVPDFKFVVVDDGSKDSTPQRLANLVWPELKVHRHSNRGHGQSCLVGYREAAKMGAMYVFQIDSDGQCDPVGFSTIWAARGGAAAIYGRRTKREDGLSRRVITVVLRLFLKFGLRTRLNDANVPFRLYRAEQAAAIADRIPPTFDLANIAMSLLMEPNGFREFPIHFRDRLGGHPTVRWWGFVKKAIRLKEDLRSIRRE